MVALRGPEAKRLAKTVFAREGLGGTCLIDPNLAEMTKNNLAMCHVHVMVVRYVFQDVLILL